MKSVKSKIAAAATLIGLGAVAGVASSSNPGQTTPTAAASAKPTVRTKVIRRTIHVTRHPKPRHPSLAQSSGAAQPAAAVPVVATEPVSAPAPPVVTQSSGGGGGSSSDESEHEGGEHEGQDD